MYNTSLVRNLTKIYCQDIIETKKSLDIINMLNYIITKYHPAAQKSNRSSRMTSLISEKFE